MFPLLHSAFSGFITEVKAKDPVEDGPELAIPTPITKVDITWS
jgi:hypothetical protein